VFRVSSSLAHRILFKQHLIVFRIANRLSNTTPTFITNTITVMRVFLAEGGFYTINYLVYSLLL